MSIKDAEWTEHTVVREGVRLACRDSGGPGAPLLFLHGLAGHAGEWARLAKALSPRYRVVVLDQRGHGASERRPAEVSRAAYVADVAAVADHLALTRPVLIGQSLGGHTAMLTAAAHPDLVRAVVMIEAGPGGDEPESPEKIGAWLDSWPRPFPAFQVAVRFFGGGPLGHGWAGGLEERDGGWWPRFDRDVMVASLEENSRRSFWTEWEQVRCPVLLVLAQSSFIPAEHVDRMLEGGPETVALSIRNTGHDLHLQQPGLLESAISRFLEQLA